MIQEGVHKTKSDRSILKGDKSIWFVVLILGAVSVLVVYSATSNLAYRQMKGNTEYYLLKHLSLMILSIITAYIIHLVDYRFIAGLSKLGVFLSVPLLIFTWKYGASINAASRWIKIPLLNATFQSSDFAQIALITYVARIVNKGQGKDSVYYVLIPSMIWSVIICGLIALTNLSGGLLLFATIFLLMFINKIRVKVLLSIIGVGIVCILLALVLGQRGRTAFSRIKTFVTGKESFQTKHSLIAIANGGIYGRGPGNSIQRNVLPHPYSDFVFAIIAEEYGLIGSVFVILLYLVFYYRCILGFSRSKNMFCMNAIFGLSTLIFMQALANMLVAVGLFPVTGLTLPFISWGGTSLLFTGAAIGAIQSMIRGKIINLNSGVRRANDYVQKPL